MVNGWGRIARILAWRNLFQRLYFALQLYKIFKGENSKFMPEKKEKINSLVHDSLGSLDVLTDTNCVIGKPIFTASGCQIIPFSKVTMGNLSGGGEYGDIKIVRETDAFPFAGGAGAVVSMKPLGFLIDDGKNCKIMRLTEEPLDNLIERAGDIMRDILSRD